MTESPTGSATRSDSGRGFSAEAVAQAKARLIAQGTTYAEWADQHGFSRRLVYEILAGRRACRRGISHRVAVALGLKNPPISIEKLHGVRG
ncbi:DNA-binding protein [Sphingomonadales bacterium 56]|uniref:DNA-binding protein n=1 Tax=unclassified Sphingobium TaxID=2611147 RepID=UPI00191ACA18|nr:DNA-binding protein [Sphingobium sp. S6]MBY2927868.1 DNA-binding protein [Sphingomonadales bacterium 56]MBY2957968.1 DNA-binding protein [Sphingomonadales bacterium 58]